MIQKLFNTLPLGKIQKEPEAISGGFQHLIYKVCTDQGTYAVKELADYKNNNPVFLKELEIKEKIASNLNSKGVQTVSALSIHNKVIQKMDNQNYVVFPWMEGRALKLSETSRNYSMQIGKTLAIIHKEKVDLKLEDIEIMPIAKESIKDLYEKNKEKLNTVKELSKNIDHLENLNTQYLPLKEKLNKKCVFSHKDLDQKNVMLKDNTLYVIDWEDAGYINPTEDVINTGLSWAGFHNLDVKKDLFKTFINAYKQENNIDFESLEDAFIVCLATWVHWVKFNMKQMIKKPNNEISKKEITETIKKINYFNKNMQVWVNWIK